MIGPGYPSAALVAELMSMVGVAEAAYRGRWRLATLERLNPELHQLLLEQQALYDQSLIRGTDEDARTQAEAMVRGWRAAVQACEDPLRPDDAYLVGYDPNTMTVVVIADQVGVSPRCQLREGQKIITVTPDEVAKIVSGLSVVMEAKSLFPDAEVVGFTDRSTAEADEVGRTHALKQANV